VSCRPRTERESSDFQIRRYRVSETGGAYINVYGNVQGINHLTAIDDPVCRTQCIRSISFRKKRLRDLEAIFFNYLIDHTLIDFAEKLNTIAVHAYRANTTLCFE